MTIQPHECPPDGTDTHGRCLLHCFECGEHLLWTGRQTQYCPSCDCCDDCGCPDADGFTHYEGCGRIPEEETTS